MGTGAYGAELGLKVEALKALWQTVKQELVEVLGLHALDL